MIPWEMQAEKLLIAVKPSLAVSLVEQMLKREGRIEKVCLIWIWTLQILIFSSKNGLNHFL